jgi:hypothetical protein
MNQLLAMARRVKQPLLLAALVATGCYAGARADPGSRGFMGHVELAGDPGAIAVLLGAHGVSVGAMRTALGWDYGFLVCYGVFLAITTAALGRWLGGKWESWGAAAAFASLVAAPLDAIENAALLHVLEGRAGARLAQLAAGVKFVLALGAVVFLLLAAIAAATRRATRTPGGPLPKPSAKATAPERTCDVVMKGGITSGIVYPRAVARLADEYRFINVGGASAGAIAASVTAAAEYARSQGRDGFAVLAQLPGWLGSEGRLFKLFRPNPETRAPFEVFAAFLGHVAFPFKLARAFGVALLWFPLSFLVGLAPGALLARAAFASPAPAWGVTGAVALSLVAVPLAIVVGLVVTVATRLPRNGFGMCSGYLSGAQALSEWLASVLEDLAGIAGRPLIFADLWTAGESHVDLAAMRAAAKDRPAADRKINFEALTTSLVHGRPYRLPDLGRTFYFQRQDLERVLPPHVVQWMVEHAAPTTEGLPPDCHALPEPHDLPVVFAARLSLSFPFLISAVKLLGIDWRRRRDEERGQIPARRRPDAPGNLDAAWMSDGGIASNFPIHFFDALVPGRPTFGLDLAKFEEDAQPDGDQAKNVFLPSNNRQGFTESWNHFRGLGGFVGALVDSLHAFMDNMQARAPGYRDRVARIYLDAEEGGLNLTMPPDVLDRLGARGHAAADKIVQRFVFDRPSGWDNHRWVRLRSLLGQLDPQLRHLARELTEHPIGADPPSYAWRSAAQAQLGRDVVEDLIRIGERLGASTANLDEDAPRPPPELRSSPRV